MSLAYNPPLSSSTHHSGDDDSLLSYAEEKATTRSKSKSGGDQEESTTNNSSTYGSTLPESPRFQNAAIAYPNETDPLSTKKDEPLTLRRIAIDLSLYLNLIIMFSKLYAYIQTLSLSVLAALTDSIIPSLTLYRKLQCWWGGVQYRWKAD